MGARNLDELRAYQAARAFKLEVYRLMEDNARAQSDFKFRDQIYDASSGVERNVAEGYGRYVAGEFVLFLRVARGCVDESVRCVQDGIDRRYFVPERCKRARELGETARRIITALITSLLPFTKQRGRARSARPPSRAPRKRRRKDVDSGPKDP
jgi:four helix bundle protein